MAENVRICVRNTEQFSSLMRKVKVMFIRRLGENGRSQCAHGQACPQILELEGGDFAAVGPDMTELAISAMPPGPGVGPNERVVRIPRGILIAARAEIPAA